MQKTLIDSFTEVKRAVTFLRSSVAKYIAYEPNRRYTPDELEPYDAMCSRFERTIDIIVNNLFRVIELYITGEPTDTFRDRLLVIEKLGLIDDTEEWFQIKMLRNKIAHTYSPGELLDIYDEIISFSKRIFKTVEKVEEFLKIKNVL